MKKILSIDGGGIRGIIPAMVLTYLETALQKRSDDANARIADYFDFVAGTSTGGILACALLLPESTGSLRAKYSAEQAVNLYMENGEKIFYHISGWRRLLSGFGAVDEKFKAKGFEEVMLNYFDNTMLSELVKPCLIATYETELRQTYFFGSHKAKNDPMSRDYFVRDVCRATSAAPSYFETAYVESAGKNKHSFIDGGIFANNPALCAYAEVRKADDEPKAAEMFLVSLGTGSTKRSYDYNSIKDKLAATLVPALIDMMMSGVAETIDFELQKMFEAVGKPDQYVRIEPASLNSVNEDMDDATRKNLDDLKALGDATAQLHRNELDRVADILVSARKDELKFKPNEAVSRT